MKILKAKRHRENILALLSSEKLPVNDLPERLEHFLVAVEGENVIGTIGLEIYGNDGLLRSLAVEPSFRDKGIAGELIQRLEMTAFSTGLNVIYLLTENAQDYFDKKGYQRMLRSDVPAAVQRSSQFSHLCPQSAIVMMKNLKG